jgi:hypothetical protein
VTAASGHDYLAQLLEAAQRCAWFLDQSRAKLDWPLDGEKLAHNPKDVALFETLAAINERFAKLQDTLAAAMRHTALLMGEQPDSFLKVLTLFEKLGVVASIDTWQQSRLLRNAAAHNYETSYTAIAEHFNTVAELSDMLLDTARRLLQRVEQDLDIRPHPGEFDAEFHRLFK